MCPLRSLFALLLTLAPLHAQAFPPESRQDALSIGLGVHSAGPMATFMVTGPRAGFFFGAATSLPEPDRSLTGAPSAGASFYSREPFGEQHLHLGGALRLDARWVLGLGLAWHQKSYRFVLHPGSAPANTFATPEGDSSESQVGPVGMADIRLGDHWGLHLVAGTGGAGIAATMRF